jgi:hypothetical protein
MFIMKNKSSKAVDMLWNIYRGCGWLLVNLFILGFLCWSLYQSFVGYRVEANGETTEGYVSGLERRDGGTYTAVIDFEVDGKAYSFDDDTSSNPPRFELGETVMVRYDRTNPNFAQIDSQFPLWLFPASMVAGLFVAWIVVNIWGVRAWKRGEEIIDLV